METPSKHVETQDNELKYIKTETRTQGNDGGMNRNQNNIWIVPDGSSSDVENVRLTRVVGMM
jgi:hypothetical protein